MEVNGNENRYKNLKWVLKDGKIVLGPKRKYKPLTLRIIAIGIMVLSFVMIALTGSQIIPLEPVSSSFVMILLFVLFLRGVQLNGIVRKALELPEGGEQKTKQALKTNEESFWRLSGENVIIKGKSYPIFYLGILSMVVKLVSVTLFVLSLSHFLTLQNSKHLLAALLSVMTFVLGYGMGSVVRKANDLYLESL